MNQVNLIGRITKDIELKETNNKKNYCRFSLAVRRDKDNTDFINCVAFEKTAELLNKFCEKGVQVGVSGEIRTGSYEDKDKKKVYTTDILITKLFLIGSSNENGNTRTTKDTENNSDDDDFPF